MSENVEKNLTEIRIISFEWGKMSELVLEDGYSVKKYEIESDKFTDIDNTCKCHYVIVSGAAEFILPEKKSKLFKGEKISLSGLGKIQVKNCGVITLVMIEICSS